MTFAERVRAAAFPLELDVSFEAAASRHTPRVWASDARPAPPQKPALRGLSCFNRLQPLNALILGSGGRCTVL
jgi:hypothetical protein